MPFWPINVELCKLTISINNSEYKTKPFSIMKIDTILLKTEGKVITCFLFVIVYILLLFTLLFIIVYYCLHYYLHYCLLLSVIIMTGH